MKYWPYKGYYVYRYMCFLLVEKHFQIIIISFEVKY